MLRLIIFIILYLMLIRGIQFYFLVLLNLSALCLFACAYNSHNSLLRLANKRRNFPTCSFLFLKVCLLGHMSEVLVALCV